MLQALTIEVLYRCVCAPDSQGEEAPVPLHAGHPGGERRVAWPVPRLRHVLCRLSLHV